MRFVLVTLVCLFVSSCATLNILNGPDDYARNYLAEDIKSGIDDGVSREAAKTPPNGYLTKPYSKRDWTEYWNRRIHYLHDIGELDTGLDQGYRGPSGEEWIFYILRSRREAGLPELMIEPRNRSRVP